MTAADVVEDVEMKEENVIECKRLGQKRDDGTARPLLITLSDRSAKSKIFKNAKSLRNTEFNECKITNDLTQMQRKQYQELWEDAKKKTEEDPSGKHFYRVVGPPWNWTHKKFEKK